MDRFMLPTTAEVDLQISTRGRHGRGVRRLQAGVIFLVRFERIVLRPRLAIAIYDIIFETLGATVGIDLGKTRVANFMGLQDVNSCVVDPLGCSGLEV